MPKLRIVMLGANRLRTLPTSFAALADLEWLLAYDNALTELPEGSAQCQRRLRLEVGAGGRHRWQPSTGSPPTGWRVL